ADPSFFRVGTTGTPQKAPSFSRSTVESRWLDGATKWTSRSVSWPPTWAEHQISWSSLPLSLTMNLTSLKRP
ncbi:MAG: hypothetical protein NTW34_00945, partial [Actinobacteria bacterium]|nr:hypothetical protein [Actinomycetota bacterium]